VSRGAASSVAAALSAAAAAAVFAGTAAPVQAQSGSITVQAGSPPTSAGSLSVGLTTADGDDISAFTAHILTASGTDVLDLPESDFTLASGTEAAGTWTINTPITTSQLLLGTYTVTIDAADDGGGSVTGADAGQLAFLIQPAVTLAANPAALGYGAASTTLSGTVTGLLPDGSTSPLAGQQVEITDSSDNAQTTQTDSAGNFSMSTSDASTFTATVRGSTLATASSAPVTVAASTAPTDLTATVSTAQVTFGQQVTVTGTLTYQPGASPEGLAGVSVVVLAPGYPDLSVPVTDSSGNFTSTFTATQSGPVQVYFNNATYQQGGSYPYLAPAQAATDPITVSLPTSLTRFSAKVATSGTLSVSGCLGVTGIPASSSLSVEGSITIQYATRRSGPWRRLGTITHTTASAGATCGVATAEASFRGAFAARLPRAYYRASFAPRSDASWLASVSSPVLAWKYRTEIKSLKVSPTRLKKGRKLTVSGQLFQHKRRWLPFGKQTIEVIWRKPDTKAWDYTVTVKTNSRGRFTATVRVSFTALWSAYYPGRSSDYSTAPPGVRVTVT
jgi:hypothetical protein